MNVIPLPVVHPCKPNKSEQLKNISHTLMPNTDEKPSIIAIPGIGFNGNQQEILKEVFPYPRSSIQTVIEKNNHSKDIRPTNARTENNIGTKHCRKKKQLNDSSVKFEANSNIIRLLDEENPKLTVDDRQHTISMAEHDLNIELESLLKEVEFKNSIVSQYENIFIELINELTIVTFSLGIEKAPQDTNIQINLENIREDGNLSSFEMLLSNAIYELKSSVTSILSEEKSLKSQLGNLLKDNQRYEKQTIKLKKSLTSLLKKIKMCKDDDRSPFYLDFPELSPL